MADLPARPRWLALDAFRGLSVAGMILVNNPGSWSHVYPPLAHAEWHGWTPTDLIFPFFLFAVGVAMTLSFGRRMAEGADRAALLRKVAWRSVAIVGFGLFLNGFPSYHLSGMRLPGVLQRIGLVYGLAATAYLLLSRSGQRRLAAALLLGYWAAMTLVPVPGVGAGSLTVEANLAQYLDSLVLSGHMWRPTWDPEGLLSTIPAVVTCLLGAFAGDWLASDRSGAEKAIGLFVAGSAAMFAGWVWSIWFPINKNLWTSSYVLLTGGMAAHLLALLYVIIDLRGWRAWAFPFVVIGMNPITIYLAQDLFDFGIIALIFTHGFIHQLGPYQPSFHAFTVIVTKWLFLYFLYRQKIFLKA